MTTDERIQAFLARAGPELDYWHETEEIEADNAIALADLLEEAIGLLLEAGSPKEEQDPTMAELLRRAVAVMLDKLNEHNPETGYLFAIDRGLTEYLTMLTVTHACIKYTCLRARALQAITNLEEKNHARHTGTD